MPLGYCVTTTENRVWNGRAVTDRETMSDTRLTYQEPTGAGKGGDEYVAATRLIASIQSFISRWFLHRTAKQN